MEDIHRTHKDVSWDWITPLAGRLRTVRRRPPQPLRLVDSRPRRGMTG